MASQQNLRPLTTLDKKTFTTFANTGKPSPLSKIAPRVYLLWYAPLLDPRRPSVILKKSSKTENNTISVCCVNTQERRLFTWSETKQMTCWPKNSSSWQNKSDDSYKKKKKNTKHCTVVSGHLCGMTPCFTSVMTAHTHSTCITPNTSFCHQATL